MRGLAPQGQDKLEGMRDQEGLTVLGGTIANTFSMQRSAQLTPVFRVPLVTIFPNIG